AQLYLAPLAPPQGSLLHGGDRRIRIPGDHASLASACVGCDPNESVAPRACSKSSTLPESLKLRMTRRPDSRPPPPPPPSTHARSGNRRVIASARGAGVLGTYRAR